MEKLNNYVNTLFEIAIDYSLQVDSVEVKSVTDSEMNDLLVKGYEKRPFVSKDEKIETSNYHPEIFIIGIPHIIYLNEQNDLELNLLSVAHGLAHADFVNRNVFLKELHTYKHQIDTEFIPFLNDVLQIEGKERVNQLFQQLSPISLYTSSPIHQSIFQMESRWYEHFLTEAVVKELNRNEFTNVALYETIIDRSKKLTGWEKDFALFLSVEAVYFYGIKKTKLMNEGWASYWQMELLKQLQLKREEKFKLALLEANMHRKAEQGMNMYSLGKRLWEQVPKQRLFEVSEENCDVTFLHHFYNESVHHEEQISSIRQTNTGEKIIATEYESVKDELLQFYLFDKPLLSLNDGLTKRSGYLTIQYVNEPYQIRPDDLMSFKQRISDLLNEKIYIKPMGAIL